MRRLYMIAALGGGLGTVAAFLQTLEKLELLRHPHTPLICDVGSVFSCTNVLNSWQASVFGFPNSIMCLALFLTFTVAVVAGWSGSQLSRGFRLGVQGLTICTLGFALWFLEQSTFAIRSLCIYCIFCFIGLLIVNWSWLRLNAADLPLKAAHRKRLARSIKTGADTFGWTILGLLVAFAITLRLF